MTFCKSPLSAGQVRVLLERHGALIEENHLLGKYQKMRLHGNESSYHRHLKWEIFYVALECGLIPFMEVPMHSKTKNHRICDLYILPNFLIIQIESCKNKLAKKWAKEYYVDFYCKHYDNELLVLDHNEFQSILLENWKKEIKKQTLLDNMTSWGKVFEQLKEQSEPPDIEEE